MSVPGSMESIFLLKLLSKHSWISTPQQPQLCLSLSPCLDETIEAVKIGKSVRPWLSHKPALRDGPPQPRLQPQGRSKRSGGSWPVSMATLTRECPGLPKHVRGQERELTFYEPNRAHRVSTVHASSTALCQANKRTRFKMLSNLRES